MLRGEELARNQQRQDYPTELDSRGKGENKFSNDGYFLSKMRRKLLG